MSTSEITEGHWTYSRDGIWDAWTATDSRTGQSHDTGVLTIPEARAFTFKLGQTKPAVRYTIESGPQRARAGHQRFPRAGHFA